MNGSLNTRTKQPAFVLFLVLFLLYSTSRGILRLLTVKFLLMSSKALKALGKVNNMSIQTAIWRARVEGSIKIKTTYFNAKLLHDSFYRHTETNLADRI